MSFVSFSHMIVTNVLLCVLLVGVKENVLLSIGSIDPWLSFEIPVKIYCCTILLIAMLAAFPASLISLDQAHVGNGLACNWPLTEIEASRTSLKIHINIFALTFDDYHAAKTMCIASNSHL